MSKTVNFVISFAKFGATVTVTVYVLVDPSSAVTVYTTGDEKSWTTPDAGLTLAPEKEISVSNDVISVPKGTVTATVFGPIAPIEAGSVFDILNEVISFVVSSGVAELPPPPPPPHAVKIKRFKKIIAIKTDAFFMSPFLLKPKVLLVILVKQA